MRTGATAKQPFLTVAIPAALVSWALTVTQNKFPTVMPGIILRRFAAPPSREVPDDC
jgi:hypothetical protein